jgi:hypothetical protein
MDLPNDLTSYCARRELLLVAFSDCATVFRRADVLQSVRLLTIPTIAGTDAGEPELVL